MATKNALVIASTVDSLIGQFRAHMLGRSLPAPAYVNLDVRSKKVSVQVRPNRHITDGLANLLLWAHTLDVPAAEWWRTSADRLHVSVDGRTAGGLRMDVYTGCEFGETAGLVQLEPDQHEIVTLDELYTLASLLREAEPRPEVAQ